MSWSNTRPYVHWRTRERETESRPTCLKQRYNDKSWQ